MIFSCSNIISARLTLAQLICDGSWCRLQTCRWWKPQQFDSACWAKGGRFDSRWGRAESYFYWQKNYFLFKTSWQRNIYLVLNPQLHLTQSLDKLLALINISVSLVWWQISNLKNNSLVKQISQTATRTTWWIYDTWSVCVAPVIHKNIFCCHSAWMSTGICILHPCRWATARREWLGAALPYVNFRFRARIYKTVARRLTEGWQALLRSTKLPSMAFALTIVGFMTQSTADCLFSFGFYLPNWPENVRMR